MNTHSKEQELANRAALERFHAAVNTRDLAVISKTIDELVDPEARISTPVPTDAAAPEAMKQLWEMLLHAFPDLHVATEDVIAEDNRLAVRNVVTGTNTGEYLGRPPTGRPVRYDEMFVLRFVDGRIVETSGVVDVLSQLRQLGAVPA